MHRYVDVRDVARAHIAAAEQPDAEGRYIICQPQSTPGREVCEPQCYLHISAFINRLLFPTIELVGFSTCFTEVSHQAV